MGVYLHSIAREIIHMRWGAVSRMEGCSQKPFSLDWCTSISLSSLDPHCAWRALCPLLAQTRGMEPYRSSPTCWNQLLEPLKTFEAPASLSHKARQCFQLSQPKGSQSSALEAQASSARLTRPQAGVPKVDGDYKQWKCQFLRQAHGKEMGDSKSPPTRVHSILTMSQVLCYVLYLP